MVDPLPLSSVHNYPLILNTSQSDLRRQKEHNYGRPWFYAVAVPQSTSRATQRDILRTPYRTRPTHHPLRWPNRQRTFSRPLPRHFASESPDLQRVYMDLVRLQCFSSQAHDRIRPAQDLSLSGRAPYLPASWSPHSSHRRSFPYQEQFHGRRAGHHLSALFPSFAPHWACYRRRCG